MARRVRIFTVPRLSMRFHAIALILITLLAAVAVLADMRATALVEALAAGAVLFAVFQTWFTVLLHHGVRYDHGIVSWSEALVAYERVRRDIGDAPSVPDASPLDVVGGDDPISITLSIIAAIILAVCWAAVLAFLLWIGLNALLAAFFAIAVPVYWLFRRSLRLVAMHSRRTQGDLAASALTALRYSLAYAACLTGILWGIDALALHLRA